MTTSLRKSSILTAVTEVVYVIKSQRQETMKSSSAGSERRG